VPILWWGVGDERCFTGGYFSGTAKGAKIGILCHLEVENKGFLLKEKYFHSIPAFNVYNKPASAISMSKKVRHDRHTVSLLTDHMVFSPKYRGKVLVGDVAMVAEAIIRKTCKELGIEIIDISVCSDHVHLFIQYPPKYSVSFIAKRLKGRSSRILRQEFPELKEWCDKSLWAPSCYHGSVGHGWEVVEKYIAGQDKKSKG